MRIVKLLLAVAVLSASVWALPPQIELDRLLLQGKTAIDKKDYILAKESLEKAEKLGLKLPDNFYYYSGMANAGTQNYEQAKLMFESYLDIKGTKGKYYRESLEYLNMIDIEVKKNEAVKEVERLKNLKLYEEQLKEYNNKVYEVEVYNNGTRNSQIESCIQKARKSCEKARCPVKNFYSESGRDGCIDFSCSDYNEFKYECLNKYPEMSMPIKPSGVK